MKPVELFPKPETYHQVHLPSNHTADHALMTWMAAHKINETNREMSYPFRWLPCDCQPQEGSPAQNEETEKC